MVKHNFPLNSALIVAGVLVVLAVGFLGSSSITGQAPRQQLQCTDSDNGQNYFVQGTTTRGSRTETDSCRQNNEVREYYCDKNDIKNYDFPCPQGCAAGACLTAQSTGAATSCDGDAVCEANRVIAKQVEADTLGGNKLFVQDILVEGFKIGNTNNQKGLLLNPGNGVVDLYGVLGFWDTSSQNPVGVTIGKNRIGTGLGKDLLLSADTGNVVVDSSLKAKNSGAGGAQLVAERTSASSGWAGVQLNGGNKNWFMYMPTGSEDLVFGDGQAKSLELDANGNVNVNNILTTKVFYADAFKLGSSPNCNPGLVYQSSQFGGTQPCGTVEVNSKAAFRDDVEFVTAYADNFKARNHVSADILTVRSASASGNAYACFDQQGNLFRSDTPCR